VGIATPANIPGTCDPVGQVFKFVWRLRLKIDDVCMSLRHSFPFNHDL
jgi:hypothetical protein